MRSLDEDSFAGILRSATAGKQWTVHARETWKFFLPRPSHLINTLFIAIFGSGSWIYLFQDTKHRKENRLCSQTPCEPPRFCSSAQKFSMLYGYFVSLEISHGRKLDDIFTRIGLPLLRLMQRCLSRSSFKPELWVSLNRVLENTFREGKRISGLLR